MDPLAGLGTVRPGRGSAQAVLHEVDVEFAGVGVSPAHGVGLAERTPLLRELNAAVLVRQKYRLSFDRVGEDQLDVVVEAGGGELQLVDILRSCQRIELVAGEGDAPKARSDVRDPLDLEFPQCDGVGGRARRGTRVSWMVGGISGRIVLGLRTPAAWQLAWTAG